MTPETTQVENTQDGLLTQPGTGKAKGSSAQTADAPAPVNLQALEVNEFQGGSLNLPPCSLKPDRRTEVQEYAEAIQLSDLSSIHQLGLDVQRSISDVTSHALNSVRLAEAGQAGEMIQGLMETMEELRPQDLKTEPGSWLQRQVAQAPVVGRYLAPKMHGVQRFIRGFESTEESMTTIVDKLDNEVVRQKEHAGRLSEVRQQLGQYVDDLGIIIEAGKIHLKSGQEQFNEKVRLFKNNTNPDRKDVLGLLEEYDKLEALDRRIDNLTSARGEALVSAASLYTVEKDCRSLEELINDGVTMMIPAWRRHVVLAIALHDQQIALKLVRAVNETTAKFIGSNSDTLRQVHAEVSQAHAEGFACVDALVKSTNDWVGTLKIGRDKSLEGTARRKEAVAKIEEAQKTVVETFAGLPGQRLTTAIESQQGTKNPLRSLSMPKRI